MIKIKNSSLENKTIIKRAGIITIILSFFSLWMEQPIAFILGLFFGLVFSVLNFRLLELTIQKSMRMHPAKAQSYVSTRYFLRYILTGGIIYVSISNPAIDILGTMIGLLIIKFVIIGSNTLNRGKNINLKQ
ncbi:MAG: ATP synthase subunit I [Eubacteriales bacterium]